VALALFMNVQRYNTNEIFHMKQTEQDPTGKTDIEMETIE
jgi:hypothetical protein